MPQLEIMRLPMRSHRGRPSGQVRTPRAYMADNDLALGRIVEALSHSRYWKDTVDLRGRRRRAGRPRSRRLASRAAARDLRVQPARRRCIASSTRPTSSPRSKTSSAWDASRSSTTSAARSPTYSSATPDLTPYDPITPTQNLDEKNPQKTAAARTVGSARPLRSRSRGRRAVQPHPLDDAEGRCAAPGRPPPRAAARAASEPGALKSPHAETSTHARSSFPADRMRRIRAD